MAIVQLQRAWYRPKQPVIHYVVSQRVLVRSRPSSVRNPRTKAQQANRSKMAVASRFLAPLQDFAIHGFKPGERPNGRPVGAYHVALGHLLNNAMRRENGQWSVDYAQVQLAEGQSLRGFPLRVKRDARALKLSWGEGLPGGTHHVRLAFHNAKLGVTECVELVAPRAGESLDVLLPKWAESGALHMWWSPVVEGKARWGSKYLLLPMGEGIIVGWVLMRKGSRAPKGTLEGAEAVYPSSRKGGNPRSAWAHGGSGGG